MQTVTLHSLTDTMYYQDIPVLKYSIQYPSFTSTCGWKTVQDINSHYVSSAHRQEEYCRMILYPKAAEAARYIQNDIPPFFTHEFDMICKITYNSGCITSLYFDRYSFTGGAHGSTLRFSDTWNFVTGDRLMPEDLFRHNPLWQQEIEKQIEMQIAEILKDNPAEYFAAYPGLLRAAFHPENFFLRPGYIVIYYQQYDIAPYATGVPEFLLPFRLPKL